jgi:probable HAF family extracellular repeat protein
MLRFLNIRNIVRAVDFNKSVTEPTRTKKGARVITLKAGMCLGCLAWMFSVPTYAARYSIEVLPDPITEASGINARGDIVGGNFVFEQRTHAVSTLSCSGTGCSVLGATAINDLGVIAGAVVDPNVGPEAAIWKSASELPTLLSPGLQTAAAAISDLGDVAGNSNNGHEDNAADLWTAPSYPEIPLGTLVTCEFCVFDPSSTAAAVNNRRRVVGSADFGYITTSDPFGPSVSGVHAFMWSDGHMTDLAATSSDPSINFDFASSVNDLDEVVGSFSAADGVTTALLDRNGVVKSLGSLDNQPTSNSQANSINDHGEIVGWSDLHPAAGQPSVPRAFVYRGGRMSNLMSELDADDAAAKTAVLTNAAAINCDGWIVANGFDSVTGANHAYLLKPKDQERRLECMILRLL